MTPEVVGFQGRKVNINVCCLIPHNMYVKFAHFWYSHSRKIIGNFGCFTPKKTEEVQRKLKSPREHIYSTLRLKEALW